MASAAEGVGAKIRGKGLLENLFQKSTGVLLRDKAYYPHPISQPTSIRTETPRGERHARSPPPSYSSVKGRGNSRPRCLQAPRPAPASPTVVSRVGASVGGGHPRILQSPSYSSAKGRGNSRRGGASRRRAAQRGPQPGGGRARRRAGGAFVKRRTARRHQWLQGGIVRWPWSHWRNLVLGEAAVGRAVDEHELPVP